MTANGTAPTAMPIGNEGNGHASNEVISTSIRCKYKLSMHQAKDEVSLFGEVPQLRRAGQRPDEHV